MAETIDRVFRLPKSDELPWYTAADLVRSGFAEYYRGQKKPQILNTMMSPAANKGHSPAKFIPTEAGLLVSRTGIGTFLWEQAVFPSLKPAWDVLGGGNVLLAILLETGAERAREHHEVRKTVEEINRKFASIPFARMHGAIWRQSGSWWNFASRLTLVYDDEDGARQQIGLMNDKFYPNLLSFLFENRCDLEGALDFRRELAAHVKVVLDRLGVTVLRADGPDDAKVNLVNQELASYWRKNGLTIDDIKKRALARFDARWTGYDDQPNFYPPGVVLLFSARRTAERGIDAEAAKTDMDRVLPMSEKVGKYEQPLPLPRSAEAAAPA